MAFPTTPVNGQQVVVNNITYQWSSSYNAWVRLTTIANIVTANSVTVTGNITTGNIISGNIVPSANVTYDLGSPARRWRDLYMSGNTIYLGSSVFTQSNGSVVIIPPPTTDFPNPTGMVISPYGTISTVTTSNGNVTGSVTTSNISSFSNITVTNQATVGNAVVTAIYSDNYKFANGTAFSSSTYGNTQVGAYLPTHSANVGASNVVVTGNVIQNGWKTYATASKLTIYYNNSPLFSIYTNGNIVAAGDITAYGSP